ncbi:hypothetical protein [Bradyrhizobium cytisi]|uniref:Uracil-DNA glycosylase-like domain-containing protein n=1 Tax=Bradyrhizobium cytisi TaxID=515489 RepID=A0A5S4WBY2_9BRAD|nr:hypothetical protein [Bradyrhizobium cytisi]TYL76750.1 hypothetical protein FXB38_30635 [Bradyrhizobium cytisi]
MDKAKALLELVAKRRRETHTQYHHFHSFDGGIWDFDYVVPWTKSACNLNARLMIIGQDWASEEFLRSPKNNKPDRIAARKATGQDEKLRTNRRLKELLEKHFSLSFSETYATDVFVFIKPGDMGTNIPKPDMLYCACKYTFPQIDQVQPVMAICLGAATFNSLREALKYPAMPFKEACEPSPHTVYSRTRTEIFGVPHTGFRGESNAGGMENVDRIWARLAEHFSNKHSSTPSTLVQPPPDHPCG